MTERELAQMRAAEAKDRLLRAALLVLQAQLGTPAGFDEVLAEVDFTVAADEEFDLAARGYVSALEERDGR